MRCVLFTLYLKTHMKSFCKTYIGIPSKIQQKKGPGCRKKNIDYCWLKTIVEI